jgi:hypothetical protein
LYEETLARSQELHDPFATTFALKQLGFVAIATGDYPTARQHPQQALSKAYDLEALRLVTDCLVAVALLFAAEDQSEHALDLLGVTLPRLAIDKHVRDEARSALNWKLN